MIFMGWVRGKWKIKVGSLVRASRLALKEFCNPESHVPLPTGIGIVTRVIGSGEVVYVHWAGHSPRPLNTGWLEVLE